MRTARHGDAPVRHWLVAFLVAAALFLVPVPAWIVDEFYSRDLYPWLQSGLTAVSNLVPIAILDVLIVAAAMLALLRVGLLATSAWRHGLSRALWEGVRRLLRAVSFVAIAFMFTWGCNYKRQPLETTLARDGVAPSTVAALQTAVSDANALAAALRPEVMAEPAATFEELAQRLVGPMNAALAHLNREPLARPGRPKFSAILTPFFTSAGVDGMIDPLVLESIVHPDLLPFERAYVLAHEWGHLAGHADEAEASAVGWFACMNGPPDLAYSASLYLILEAAAALPADARRQAYASLAPGVRTDLEAIGRRLQKQQPQVQYAANRVYDQYLKANRVADGTASYSRALRLILSAPIRDALSEYRTRARPGAAN